MIRWSHRLCCTWAESFLTAPALEVTFKHQSCGSLAFKEGMQENPGSSWMGGKTREDNAVVSTDDVCRHGVNTDINHCTGGA